MNSRRALFRSGHIQLSGPNGPGGIRSAGGGRGHGAGGGRGHGAGGGHGHGRGTTLPPGQLIAALATVGAASSGNPGVVPPKATYLQTVLADSPAGYWKMDETSGTSAADSSGNGHTGTYSSLTLGTAPLINQGHAVTNTTAQAGTVTVNSSASFTGTGHLTVEGWLRGTGDNSSVRTLIHADEGFSAPRYFTFATNQTTGVIAVNIFDTGAAGHTANGVTNANDGARHYAAFTYDGAHIVIYLDGNQDSSTAATFALSTATPPLRFFRPVSATLLGIGVFDEFAVYTAALSATRIAAHYQAGL